MNPSAVASLVLFSAWLAPACGSEVKISTPPEADAGAEGGGGADVPDGGRSPEGGVFAASACGWDVRLREYSCQGSGADPSGVHPRDCPTDAAPGERCAGPSSTCCDTVGALGCVCPDCEGCVCRWQRARCL
jgi:hypothetical protein